mmetsp:Transcript_36959/g.81143  ORF Transcript_36959/g.81143 Transcript_36959/m.81143 type:complete len:201 (+) Transcript_36959:60-662(+)
MGIAEIWSWFLRRPSGPELVRRARLRRVAHNIAVLQGKWELAPNDQETGDRRKGFHIYQEGGLLACTVVGWDNREQTFCLAPSTQGGENLFELVDGRRVITTLAYCTLNDVLTDSEEQAVMYRRVPRQSPGVLSWPPIPQQVLGFKRRQEEHETEISSLQHEKRRRLAAEMHEGSRPEASSEGPVLGGGQRTSVEELGFG